MDYALSNNDVEKIVGEPLKITPSSELKDKKCIFELFYPESDKALILFDSEKDEQRKTITGHWCALLINEDGISFYDPYGHFIDDQLKYIPKSYRRASGQFKNELTRLLYHSPFQQIHYNPYKHQNEEGSNTCGRHCALFLRMGEEPEKYNDALKDASKRMGLSTDKTALALTKPIIGM
jgi:hypothetical protein